MSKNEPTKIEIDSKTIKAIATVCELSGLEMPDVLTTNIIDKSAKRIKELLLKLKNQTEKQKEQLENDTTTIEDLKKRNDEFKQQIVEFKDQLKDLNAYVEHSKNQSITEKLTEKNKKEDIDNDDESEDKTPRIKSNIKKILIIANIGVIMHQLKVLFRKVGCQVTSVKTYSEGIGQLKDNKFDCILFDIQAANENDLMLIEGLKKATDICHADTTIVVLVLPMKDKKTPKLLKSKGASVIIEKHESWHINILDELKIESN